MRSEPDGDAALLRAVATGDEGALRLLVERNAPWLDARLRRRCADPDVVADVLQDTFVAAWNGAGRWRGDGEVAAWLWGIAVRRLVSRLRGRPAPAVGAAVEGHLASAEEQVLLGVEHGDLGAALRRLSPELRAVMQATALDGLTDREAAHLLGLPLGTVKGRLRRARRAAGRGPRRRVPAAARRPGDPPVRPAPAVPARRRPHRPRLRRRAGAPARRCTCSSSAPPPGSACSGWSWPRR